MAYFGQNLFNILLVVAFVFVAVEGRASYYDTNGVDRISPDLTFYQYYPYGGLNRYPDAQYEKLRILFEGQQDGKAVGGALEEPLLREPESKRQAVRYRQCYFNPISCFRK